MQVQVRVVFELGRGVSAALVALLVSAFAALAVLSGRCVPGWASVGLL